MKETIMTGDMLRSTEMTSVKYMTTGIITETMKRVTIITIANPLVGAGKVVIKGSIRGIIAPVTNHIRAAIPFVLQHSKLSGFQKSHRRKRSRSVEDDEEGHLICESGDVLRARYEIVATLGEGAFGKVVECIDHDMRGMHVAVKIVKNVGRYREAARSEIQVLEHLNTMDPSSTFRCVQMLEWFDHHGHVCIVFELLGLSTYDFIKENSFLPFHINDIRNMAYQICQSINFLHHNKLTHTDLKPENILFVESDYIVKYNAKMVSLGFSSQRCNSVFM
ncbi:hypothetical protein CIB84_004039 [Bambusicola thoracicus]|uniref:dual-specificity kinase n=1 Tax=Bambusicola thoracicus TaxID=9083 RepID=A0A2P4T763_BAMTH|nr:hypothetical protein CIB84_004039 [Bambusicola thoracicus]